MWASLTIVWVQVVSACGVIFAWLGRKVSITAARWFIASYPHLCVLQANPIFLFNCFLGRKVQLCENLLSINLIISVILLHLVIYKDLLNLIYFASNELQIVNGCLWHQDVGICTTFQQNVYKKVKPVTAVVSEWTRLVRALKFLTQPAAWTCSTALVSSFCTVIPNQNYSANQCLCEPKYRLKRHVIHKI